MEFSRFGSSIPTRYWGCCCADIIQDFNKDPDAKASIQLTDGDGNSPITRDGELAFAGPTYKDIFETRIRIGTFGTRDMPNHAFFAILTASQCNSAVGKKWLAILKANGFEYLRTVNNSVWNVNNHVFALFRNVGPNKLANAFTPPSSWTNLPTVVPEAYQSDLSTADKRKDFTKQTMDALTPVWAAGTTVIRKESDIVAAGAPVVMGALRTEFPVELKASREKRLQERKEKNIPVQPSVGSQHI